MSGSTPSPNAAVAAVPSPAVSESGIVVELSSEDLIDEVEENRASILSAAASASNIAMLTGTHGVISPPLLTPRVRLPLPGELHPNAPVDETDAELGRLRAFVAARKASAASDSVGELRAHLELARAELDRGHLDAAKKQAEAAASSNAHAPAAHAMLRALSLGRDDINEQLSHVSVLAAGAAKESIRADWLCERARLLEARDSHTAESVAVWNEALMLAPDHGGAIYGSEAALEATGKHAELAEMLGRLAELVLDGAPPQTPREGLRRSASLHDVVVVREGDAAAWFHVERSILLDRRIHDVPSARAALMKALELSPGLGPVRAACVDHAVCHRDDAWLGGLLETEAALEPDRVRAARLELDAALAHMRANGDRGRIIKALERAYARAPSSPIVDARVAEELARLYDADNRHGDALRARKALLKAHSDDPREELVVLRAIATSAERSNETDDAVLALERARVLESDDPTLLADLDRLLKDANRHEARTILWMREAARVEDASKKAEALLASAEAARAGGKEIEAAKQREAAWITAPTAPGVYDALAARLTPIASGDAVRERIALYEQAARSVNEPDRKIHLLEKIAWLHDDVAGDTAGAARTYEEILSIEPARLSAIIGLASAATRAGDDKRLARALSAQADVTVDQVARAELRLRASQALASVDPERALALAEDLRNDSNVRARASEVVTRLHSTAGRWERAAETLAQRNAATTDSSQKIALVLAEVDVLLGRLRAPERALTALSRMKGKIADDAAIRAATLQALEVLGDEDRLRVELNTLAENATSSPHARAKLFVRVAELDEARNRDADAVRAYERALAALPDDAFIADRIRRIGARVPIGDVLEALLVSPLTLATRAIDTTDVNVISAEPLLASGARDVASLRMSERLARRAGSAPQLANALALIAEAYPTGLMARRALEGLASLFAWTLPENDDYEPWERLLALGSSDAAGLDTLVHRARKRVSENDKAAVVASLRAIQKRIELISDDTERLLYHLDLARLHRRIGATPEAGGDCKRALGTDPSSLSASCFLAEIAAELDDDEAAIAASRALAGLMSDARARAELLRDAADLSSVRGDKTIAAELLEAALLADPEGVQVAARLADLQRTRKAYADLARVLREALTRAQTAAAIVPMASELAEVAKNNLRDPMLAIVALERIRAVDPGHVASLFLLAELFIGQRAWDKALTALAQATARTNEKSDKLVALVGRASIFRRVLNQPLEAEAELRKALEIDAHDTRAIRGLLDLGGERIAKDERAALLGRLVVGETGPAERMRALIELAEARRVVGDAAGAEGALVEAASLSPDPRMLEHIRVAVGPNDGPTLARVLSKAVARAHEHGRAIDPQWLVGLGNIELELGRFDEAIERFEEALRGDETRDDARVALARAFSARGRHDAAAAALAPVISGQAQHKNRKQFAVDANIVRLYEASLSGAGRSSEQWVARELRAIAGDLAPGEQAELDKRISNLAYAEGLSAASLRGHVMPGNLGRHPIWDVAALCTQLAGKLVKVSLSDQGSSSRDRVKPKAAHPIRPLFDRVHRAFELGEVELAVSDHVTVPSIACEDVPWVIVPSSLGTLSDAQAVAMLARPMARIALGVPWIGALAPHEVLALIVAFARQVAPSFTATPRERVEPLIDEYEQKAKRGIDRKRRRMLEELEPMLERATPVDVAAFAEAVAMTEARAAFLLSGSFRASLEAIASAETALASALRVPGSPSLAAVFGSAALRDLVAFALNPDTTALRRSLGTA